MLQSARFLAAVAELYTLGNSTSRNDLHVIFASGPYLTPDLLLFLLVLLACPVLELALFIYSLVLFHRGKAEPGFTCILLSVLFLIPLWELQSDGLRVIIAFAIVSVVACPIWMFYS